MLKIKVKFKSISWPVLGKLMVKFRPSKKEYAIATVFAWLKWNFIKEITFYAFYEVSVYLVERFQRTKNYQNQKQELSLSDMMLFSQRKID